jgi:hypothetical protein
MYTERTARILFGIGFAACLMVGFYASNVSALGPVAGIGHTTEQLIVPVLDSENCNTPINKADGSANPFWPDCGGGGGGGGGFGGGVGAGFGQQKKACQAECRAECKADCKTSKNKISCQNKCQGPCFQACMKVP